MSILYSIMGYKMSFDEGKSQMYEHYLCINDVPTLYFFVVILRITHFSCQHPRFAIYSNSIQIYCAKGISNNVQIYCSIGKCHNISHFIMIYQDKVFTKIICDKIFIKIMCDYFHLLTHPGDSSCTKARSVPSCK